MSNLDDLLDQLNHFEFSTLININLVNIGARNATLIEHAYGYLPNSEEYEIEHTIYPEEFKAIFDDYFLKKYRKEIDRLFVKRLSESMNKYYPELHMTKVKQGILITKNPLDDKVIESLQKYNHELMGEVLEYPGRANFMKPGHKLTYSIEAILDIPGFEIQEVQVFANKFCDPEHQIEFEMLAKKYEDAFKTKNNILQKYIVKIEL